MDDTPVPFICSLQSGWVRLNFTGLQSFLTGILIDRTILICDNKIWKLSVWCSQKKNYFHFRVIAVGSKALTIIQVGAIFTLRWLPSDPRNPLLVTRLESLINRGYPRLWAIICNIQVLGYFHTFGKSSFVNSIPRLVVWKNHVLIQQSSLFSFLWPAFT